MAYALTEQDIADMIAAGMNVMDAIPGAPATDAEKKFLGVQEDVEPNAFPEPVALAPAEIATQQASSFNPAATTAQAPIMSVGDVGSQMQDLSAATPPVNMQGQLSAAQDASPSFLSSMGDTLFGPKEAGDQFANLNRQQRMMLAFGAVKDAGFALQGKESNSFSSTLKAINDQMDMGRKASAVKAQQAALQSVLGGANVGGQNDFDAQRQRLQQALVAGAIDAPTFTAMMSEIARKQQAGNAEIDLVTGASNVLETIEGMKSRVNNLTTGPLGMAAAMLPWSDASALRNMGTTLESNLAFDTLVALKAAGGTLGAVSEAELKLLKSEISKFDANMKPQDVIAQLDRVDREYRRLITRAFATTPDVAKLESALGGRPAWLDAPTSSTSEPLSDADFIEQERKRREGNG